VEASGSKWKESRRKVRGKAVSTAARDERVHIDFRISMAAYGGSSVAMVYPPRAQLCKLVIGPAVTHKTHTLAVAVVAACEKQGA
jgi:hypothetical protein